MLCYVLLWCECVFCTQNHKWGPPFFQTRIVEDGFVAIVCLPTDLGECEGHGRTKKEAEKQAALDGCRRLQELGFLTQKASKDGASVCASGFQQPEQHQPQLHREEPLEHKRKQSRKQPLLIDGTVAHLVRGMPPLPVAWESAPWWPLPKHAFFNACLQQGWPPPSFLHKPSGGGFACSLDLPPPLQEAMRQVRQTSLSLSLPAAIGPLLCCPGPRPWDCPVRWRGRGGLRLLHEGLGCSEERS
jgi:hypothetical protein